MELVQEDRELESEVGSVFSPGSNKRKFNENGARKMRLVEAVDRRGKFELKARHVSTHEEEEAYKAQFTIDQGMRNTWHNIVKGEAAEVSSIF